MVMAGNGSCTSVDQSVQGEVGSSSSSRGGAGALGVAESEFDNAVDRRSGNDGSRAKDERDELDLLDAVRVVFSNGGGEGLVFLRLLVCRELQRVHLGQTGRLAWLWLASVVGP